MEPGGWRVRAQYDRLATAYDRRWHTYIARSTAETLARLPPGPDVAVLDVGAGTGLLLDHLRRERPAARLVGADLSPGMLGVARERLSHAVALVGGDAESLPFRAARFDIVISSSSLHYWQDPAAELRELARVLRPGGHLVVTDWCHDYLTCRLLDRVLRVTDPAHHRTLGTAQLSRHLVAAGCDLVSIDRYRLNWFWGMMTAVAKKPVANPG